MADDRRNQGDTRNRSGGGQPSNPAGQDRRDERDVANETPGEDELEFEDDEDDDTEEAEERGDS